MCENTHRPLLFKAKLKQGKLKDLTLISIVIICKDYNPGKLFNEDLLYLFEMQSYRNRKERQRKREHFSLIGLLPKWQQ